MKGIVLAMLGLAIGTAAAFGEQPDTKFGVTANNSSAMNSEILVRPPIKTSAGLFQLVADDQGETRGSRPSIACTVFRFDSKAAAVSLQPVFGRINGAQVYLSF